MSRGERPEVGTGVVDELIRSGAIPVRGREGAVGIDVSDLPTELKAFNPVPREVDFVNPPQGGEVITPLEDRVLILPDPAEAMTRGGIALPDVAKEKPHRGTIMAAGPGRFAEMTGVLVPMALRVGDRVLYERYAGVTFTSGGVEYRIMREKDIAAKLGVLG